MPSTSASTSPAGSSSDSTMLMMSSSGSSVSSRPSGSLMSEARICAPTSRPSTDTTISSGIDSTGARTRMVSASCMSRASPGASSPSWTIGTSTSTFSPRWMPSRSAWSMLRVSGFWSRALTMDSCDSPSMSPGTRPASGQGTPDIRRTGRRLTY